jgi:hypothetical protein
MNDRIGNKLAVGDRVLVNLPDATVIGFISEAKETSVLAQVRGNGVTAAPGRVLVACVLAFPVDSDANAVGNVVKVHDPTQDASQAMQEGLRPLPGTSEPPRTN